MSKKNVPALRLVDRDEAPQLPELSGELRLALTEVAGAAREGLLAMSVGVGLCVFRRDDGRGAHRQAGVGAKHAKVPSRTASRHGIASGSVVLGGRRVPVERPRARTVDGSEVTLDTYTAAAGDDLLSCLVLERMLAGLATRRHRAAIHAALSTSAATSPTTSPRPSGAGSTGAWPGRSAPIPTPACARPATWPDSSRPAGPTRRPACARG